MSSSRLCGFGLVAGAVLTAAAGAQASLIVPAYHSLPGAHAKLYVDFDGTTWAGKTPGTVPAYDVDGDPANFSTGELANIQQIAHRVAEKYSPFNIDVTTVNPGNENNLETAHLVVGGNVAWYGAPAGGVTCLRRAALDRSTVTEWRSAA